MSDLGKYIQKENFQKIKLLSDKKIGICKWRMKEEKDFLFAVETQMDNKELLVDESLKLARKCVDDVDMFNELSRNDLVFLLSQLRKISKGTDIEFTYKCINKECATWIEFSPEIKKERKIDGEGYEILEEVISMDDDIKVKNYDPTPAEINDKKFYLKEVSFNEQRKLEQDYLDKDKPNLNEFNYNFVLSSIKGIEIGDTMIEDFTKDELKSFIDNMETNDFMKLSMAVGDKISEFSITKKAKCPTCKNESDIIYEEMFSLMIF